jgi:hypothetical protein
MKEIVLTFVAMSFAASLVLFIILMGSALAAKPRKPR